MTLHLVKEGAYAASLLSPAVYDLLDAIHCEDEPTTSEHLIKEYETLSDYLTVELDHAFEYLIENGLIACWPDKQLVITKRGKEVITFSEKTRV